jgi:hypothetical protein
MRRDIGKLLALVLVVSCVSCAGRHNSSKAPGLDKNVVTGEEILNAHFITPMDALEALHPTWLRARGPDSFSSPSEVQVYLDNVRVGGVDTLRSIDVRIIHYIRHFDGVAATARYGVGHAAGVIFVSTQN